MISESIEVRSRSFFSIVHIQAAALFAREAWRIEEDHDGSFSDELSAQHRSFVTSGVVSAVAFLEATVNEVFAEASEPQGGILGDLGQDVVDRFRETWSSGASRFSVLEKFQVGLVLAGRETFDRGRPPFQDVKLLSRLRNDLIHFEPRWVDHLGGEESPNELSGLAAGLVGKFAENPLTGAGNPFYPDRCLGHGCVEWAVQSSIGLADQFYSGLGLDIRYEHVRDRLETR